MLLAVTVVNGPPSAKFAPLDQTSSYVTAASARLATDRPSAPKIQLPAVLPQQLKYTILELELPRLLAPDLPSNGYSF